MENDIQDDSGRYLQEYVQSLENLPSEIKYHWAEVLNRNETAQKLERKVHSHQHDLAKFHKQWFQAEFEKKQKIQSHEPVLIKRIQRDYDKLEELATERIELVEGALQLVDRHLNRLSTDLDTVDGPRPPSTSSPYPTLTTLDKRPVYQEQEDIEDIEEEESIKQEQQRQRQQLQQRRKRKERDETIINNNNEGEPLYCYCRQVSFGEMVGCDGENCPYEWFHMECVGLTAPPKGSWYCDECLAENKSRKSNTTTSAVTTSSGQASSHHKKMKRKKDSTPS